MTRQPDYLEKAQQWIRRLDHGDVGGGRSLYVYPVQHGTAKHLASLLSDIFNGNGNTSESNDTAPDSRSIAPTREISILDSTQNQSTGLGSSGLSDPTTFSPSSLTRDTKNSGFETETGLRVIADNANNALLILANSQEYETIVASLAKLDIQPLQVLIEATIADVTLNDDLRFGVQWFFQHNSDKVTLTDSTTSIGTLAAEVPGFSWTHLSSDANVVLSALSSVTKVRILSRPMLTVLDNQTANLQVGDEVPVITRQSQSTLTTDAPIVNQVEFRDTGVILNVTPRVNASGMVTLDIQQEVSDVVKTTTSGIDTPTIRQRKISTTVAVQSSQTIALGGLIREDETVGNDGVPFVKDIPLIGLAAKHKTTSHQRAELLVLLTPRVIRNVEDINDITDELKSQMSGITKPVSGS